MSKTTLSDFLLNKVGVPSRSELRKLRDCQALKINSVVIDNLETEVKAGDVVEIGKKRKFEVES